GRLALDAARENAYGCTPFPAADGVDFASSTASSVSPEGYQRAHIARQSLLAQSSSQGADAACESAVEEARTSLLDLLNLQDSGAQVVFSASGTDAQLQALL